MVWPLSSCSRYERAPCSTPGVPPVIVAACRPVSTPSPPASRPIRRTPSSGTNAVKMPIALEPPPTQARTASGSRPSRSQHLRARLVADHPLEVADHRRERVRAGDGAEDVVRRLDVGDPVAERLVDRVLERARAGGHRDDLGAEQPHAGDVERLAAGVLLAHVDGAGQPHQGRRGRRRDAVLAGAGLGDDPRLADPLGEQRLAEHVVDLVRAGVVEVLALEQDPGSRRRARRSARPR